jgi:hypothetical protein
VANLQQTDSAQGDDRFPERRPTHVQITGQVAFGRHALSKLEPAVDDAGDQSRGDLVCQAAAADRAKGRSVLARDALAPRLQHTPTVSIEV